MATPKKTVKKAAPKAASPAKPKPPAKPKAAKPVAAPPLETVVVAQEPTAPLPALQALPETPEPAGIVVTTRGGLGWSRCSYRGLSILHMEVGTRGYWMGRYFLGLGEDEAQAKLDKVVDLLERTAS